MATAKDIILRPVSAAEASAVVKRVHYSGKVVQNSQIHIGVFLAGKLEGALQFGPSLDKRKIQGLVSETGWNDFIELNRMAFSEALPRNSESRALGVAMRILKQHAPHLKWVVSFADATQCGDGTIYRASGFVLTGITKSMNLIRRGDGTVIHKMTLESGPTRARPELGGRSYYDVTGGKYDLNAYAMATGGCVVPGYQFRYVYFLDPTARERLTVPIIPFDKIPPECRMYRGQPMRPKQATPGDHPDGGGAAPTRTLHSDATNAIPPHPAASGPKHG